MGATRGCYATACGPTPMVFLFQLSYLRYGEGACIASALAIVVSGADDRARTALQLTDWLIFPW